MNVFGGDRPASGAPSQEPLDAVKVKFKKLHPDAKLPQRARFGDAAFDLSAFREPSDQYTFPEFRLPTTRPHNTLLVPTGVAIEIPYGYCGLVLPRSGLAIRAGVTVINSPGLIDPGYRGEIMVGLINHGWHEYKFFNGERIAQLLILKLPHVVIEEVQALTDSERGEGGFGSTGL
jgi:dUTP pyrophosphatase